MKRLLTVIALSSLLVTPLPAQDCCSPCGQEYRLVCRTIYEEQPVTTRRLEYETVTEERQVVSYKPVWETTMKERRYTVSKPVVETSTREERRTVMKPVWEVRYRDASYTRTRYVNETSTREERRTVMKPVVEMQTRKEERVVHKPVVETTYQDQVTTTYRPVTNYYQRTVDMGGYQNQVSYAPGESYNRLRWMRPQCLTNPVTGENKVLRPGLYWVPQQGPPKTQVNKVYVPNPVTQQMAQTQYVPQQVTQKVPVNITKMQAEVQVREVPVQITRMVAEEQVRSVPVTVRRPVTETVPKYVKEYRCRYVPEEEVRTIPVNTYKLVKEERVEQIPVKTCKMETEYRTVEVKRRKPRWVIETSTRVVPRRVWVKEPINTFSNVSVPKSFSSDSTDAVTKIAAKEKSTLVKTQIKTDFASETKPIPVGKRPVLEGSNVDQPVDPTELPFQLSAS